jgi:haloacetate dehalogenase
VHGFPQNKAMWARVAPTLAANHTVVCADLRGYGDSSKPRCLPDKSNYAFKAMAADQLNLMRALGFERFHLIGHDRGGRTGHRLALDHPDAVISLTVMDIVPTYAMFMDTNRKVAGSYWHWYFLSQPEPFPERLIGNDPASSTRPALWVGARRGFRISTKRCSPTIAAPGAIPR